MSQKQIMLKVKSSNQSTFYNIDVTNEDGVIKIKCDCRAGTFKWGCRHKIAILRGDSTCLLDDYQKEEYCEVIKWINNSSLPLLITKYNTIEDNYLKLKNGLNLLKNKILEPEEAEDIFDDEEDTDISVNGKEIYRYDLLKTYFNNIKSRDQKYYENRNPYSNPEYLNMEKDFLKAEADFKLIKSALKTAMKNGA